MKANSRKLVSMSVFAVVAGAAVNAYAGPVPCGKTNDLAEQRACAAAAKGVADLRQFIQRTRGIYILSIHDFESSVPTHVARAEEKPASKKES